MIRTALASVILAAAASSALAEIQLAPMFSDHMVVQRGLATPLWGKATPGSKVELFLNDGTPAGSTVANDGGFFRMKLPALNEKGPHTLTVKAGDDSVTVNDVLAGEVWICSGQSNMQWSIWDSANREAEVKNANYPEIRFFTVPRKTADVPMETIDAKWEVCSPETISGFSAVGYFFGRELHQQLDVPVGLINASWGGTIAETWTPKKQIEAMNDLPGVAKLSTQLKDALDPNAREKADKVLAEWAERLSAVLNNTDAAAQGWEKSDLSDADWKTIAQPGNWVDQASLPNGLGWLRRTVDVPAEWEGKEVVLSLGRVDDYDVTYFNGEQVGTTPPSQAFPWNTPRNYEITAGKLKAGKNTIAVRVLDTGGAAGLAGPGPTMKLSLKSDPTQSIPLAGDWKVKSEKAIDPQADPRPSNPTDPGAPNLPSRLYNAMIHPLGDYGIRGAIWYQGESNAGRFDEYEKVLSSMIGAWREQFGVGDFPFYQVGLANFRAPTDDANKVSDWAGLREAQRQIGLNVNNAGVTVTIDIGEEKDIHPRNKQDVGKRLALQALNETYGKELVSRGPTFKGASFEEGKVVLRFDHIGGGLVAKDGSLASFSIAGDDGTFAWADAKIEGDTVVLTSKAVAHPTRVRYAFADNPTASLFNKEGLPAEPFEAKK